MTMLKGLAFMVTGQQNTITCHREGILPMSIGFSGLDTPCCMRTCASKRPKVSGRKLAAIVEPHASSKNAMRYPRIWSNITSFLISQNAENRD
jgi:hypothetical protein